MTAPVPSPWPGPIAAAAASRPRIVVGISGATGVIYGIRLLETLRGLGVETHLVVSRAGDLTRAHETGLSARALRALADHAHGIADVAAPIASGSFRTLGMVVAPCSMRTLAEIASGVSSTLLTRAADVTLQERRGLVPMVRETPLSSIHLRNMLPVTDCGGVIFPPVAAFYNRPASVDDMINHHVARVLDLFGLDMPGVPRWGEAPGDTAGVRSGPAAPA